MKERENPQIIQSYSITEFPRNIGIYGERIILRLAQLAYDAVTSCCPDFDFSSGEIPNINYEKANLRKGCSIYKIQTPTKNYFEITIPAHDIMPYGDTSHYSVLKEHLKGLMNVILEKNKDDVKKFQYYHLINDIEGDTKVIRMNIRSEVWDALLNFSKGYRYYNINKALTLNSAYSLRFYLIVAGQKQPVTFSINYLREMFDLKEKFSDNNTFIKKVVQKAKDELDIKTPYSFDYSLQRQTADKKGRPGISAVTILPKYIQSNDTDENIANTLKSRITLFGFDETVSSILFKQMGFTTEEIQNNYDLFMKANKLGNLTSVLEKIKPKACRAANPKGYVIQTLKAIYAEQNDIFSTNQQ